MIRTQRYPLSSGHKLRICLAIPLITALIFFVFNPSHSMADTVRAKNTGHHDYWSWRNWAENTYSYLVTTSDGYMIFEGADDGKSYLAEYYDSSFNLKSSKTITSELPLFGCFYSDGSNYYVLSGQNNLDESSAVECYRLTKYDKSWNKLTSCGLSNCNTCIPFDAGSAAITSSGSYLVVRTCHEMYTSDDGLRHQANLTILINTSTMKILDSQYAVSYGGYGYCSHSFNQYVKLDGNYVIGADHGDAYPRSMAISRGTADITKGTINSNNYSQYDVLPIAGNIGDNYTYATLGGLEISGSNYMIVGSSKKQDGSSSTMNVFVGLLNKSSGATSYKWLTGYGSSDTGAGNPFLVKISDNKFAVIWMQGDKLNYAFIDGSGNLSGSIKTVSGFLSDCQPIVSGDKIVWYAYDGKLVNFFSINTSSGEFTAHSPTDISHVTVASIAAQTYTGSAITPSLTITYGGANLVQDTDYTVSYTNNINYGTATVTITGKGKYTGSRTATFSIARKDISTLTLSPIADCPYTGYSVTPEIELYYGSIILVKGTDYYMSCSNNINIGTATVTITGRGNYTGTLSSAFNVVGQAPDNLTYSVTDMEYTGFEVTPNIVIKNGTKTLIKNTDYTVTYSDNVKVGTGYATITFMGNYTGTKVISFNILKKDISHCYISIYSQTYTGSAVTSKPTVKLNSSAATPFVEGTDYTLSYSNNINVGTATVTITGIGEYLTGSIAVNFNINPIMASWTTCTFNDTYYYTGFAIEPEFTLTYGDITFKKNVDYTVSYIDNIESGYGYAVITGTGTGLSGTVSRSFYINRLYIGNLTFSDIPDQYYTGSAVTPSVVIKNGSKTLTAGTDYTVSYLNNVNEGTATAIITGVGNYTGTKQMTFKISGSAVQPDIKPGWQQTGGKWYYFKTSGDMVTGWYKVDGTWYYLDPATGAMVTGWLKENGMWYYLRSGSGAMVTGWLKDNGTWYYLKSDGVMATGWQQVGGKWYFFESGGNMVTGWKKVGNVWYYLNSDGSMATGWKQLGGTWYYLKSDGTMATGWQELGGIWYFFEGGGNMVTGTKTIGGKAYEFDSSGACKNPYI